MIAQLPKISIVTPSLNQGQYIEETILSVLGQKYSNLEYIVIDGGSTDGTVDRIRKYEKDLSCWLSEPDQGQYHALQKGFEMTTGEIMAWINSDDKYTTGAFELVSEVFRAFPQVEWLSSVHELTWGERSYAIACQYAGGFNAASFFRGGNLPGRSWYARSFIQQESTFWRRSLWERAGGHLDTSIRLAADFELWSRFFLHADLYGVVAPLGGFRMQPDQKTAHFRDEYVCEAEMVLRRHAKRLPGNMESLFRSALWTAFGCRTLNKMPSFLRRFLCACNLLYPAKVLVYESVKRSWEIVTYYLI